jgi:hypothetical protein
MSNRRKISGTPLTESQRVSAAVITLLETLDIDHTDASAIRTVAGAPVVVVTRGLRTPTGIVRVNQMTLPGGTVMAEVSAEGDDHA